MTKNADNVRDFKKDFSSPDIFPLSYDQFQKAFSLGGEEMQSKYFLPSSYNIIQSFILLFVNYTFGGLGLVMIILPNLRSSYYIHIYIGIYIYI